MEGSTTPPFVLWFTLYNMMHVLVHTPNQSISMTLPDDDSRVDDQGRKIFLICDGRFDVQYEVERQFPSLPYEIQDYLVEVPQAGEQHVRITPAKLEFYVRDTVHCKVVGDNRWVIEFYLAWKPSNNGRPRVEFFVQREGNHYFLRGKHDDTHYDTVRALLQAELRPALHPILLTDEVMNDPRILSK